MQLAQILSPEENLTYVMGKFKELLPESCEELKSNKKDLEQFSNQMDKIMSANGSRKNPVPDAFEFIDYVTSKDLAKYVCLLKPKPTKKKPFSFDRFNIIVMPVFKFMESNIKKDAPKIKESLFKWLSFIKSQKEQNLNTLFETLLNLFLVLSEDTVMKSTVFIHMTCFLQEKGQLESVMIQQVKDITNLSAEWNLNDEERLTLYTECASALDREGDSQGAFDLYFQSLSLVDAKNASKYQKEATQMIVNAIKGPQVINFEEVFLLEAVTDLKKTSKPLFDLVDLFMKADVAAFKKSLSKMNKLMDEHKIQMDQAVMKKQYVDICIMANKSENAQIAMSTADLKKILDCSEDEIEEWIIEAMSNGIIDAQIDQINNLIIIKTFKLRVVDKNEWAKIQKKIVAWKERFQRIEKILSVQPEAQ